MANSKKPVVFDGLENRQLFAFAGGFSPTPFMQIDSSIAIVVSLNRITLPFANMPWHRGFDNQPIRRENNQPTVPSTPTTDDADSAAATSTTATRATHQTPTTDGQTQVLSFASIENTVPEVQVVSDESRKIKISSTDSNNSQLVPVKILNQPIFNTNPNLTDTSASKALAVISPELISSLASSVMSTQKLLASSLLGELKSNTTHARQVTQVAEESELNEQPIVQESPDETPATLAMVQPSVMINKTLITRIAIGITAFMVFSYWWTRRLATRTRSIVIKTENDTTLFDR